MIIMEIELKDCTIEKNIITYIMSDAFLKLFLEHKFKLFEGYPPFVDVRGKKVLRFDYVGVTGKYHLYKNNQFQLHIKYN